MLKKIGIGLMAEDLYSSCLRYLNLFLHGAK